MLPERASGTLQLDQCTQTQEIALRPSLAGACCARSCKSSALGFSGATEPDFALFVGSRAAAVEGTEGVQERGRE